MTTKKEPDPVQVTAMICPFCAYAESRLLDTIDITLRRFWVFCRHCAASGPAKDTAFEAIIAWNDRRGT